MIKLKSESIKVYLSAVLNKNAEDLTEEDINQIDRIFISGLDELGHSIPFDFEDLEYFPSLNSLIVSNASISVEGIRQMSSKRSVKEIDFEKCEFENEESLKSLNHLESLGMFYCTTKKYDFLKGYFRLKRFMIIDPKDETPLDVSLLGGNFDIRELMLQRCILSNEGAIALLPNIELLSILWTSFGDSSTESLKSLKKLKKIYTSSPTITAIMENYPNVEVRNNLNDLLVDFDEASASTKTI